MSFEEFQNGRYSDHLGYRNGMVLAILNLYKAPMPPIKFRLNLTYGLGDVVWRITRWPPWRPSWIPERNDFSNSESLCHCDASHQVLSESAFWFGRRCCLKNFQNGRHGGHLGYRNWSILAILNLYVAPMPHTKFWSFGSIWLIVWEEMLFEEFQNGGYLGYRNWTI